MSIEKIEMWAAVDEEGTIAKVVECKDLLDKTKYTIVDLHGEYEREEKKELTAFQGKDGTVIFLTKPSEAYDDYHASAFWQQVGKEETGN